MGLQIFQRIPLRENITIVTDHRPLSWIFSDKDPSSRLLRWRLKLEEYEYEVIYKKGTNNTNADALSRIHITEGHTNSLDKKSELTDKEKKQYWRNCMINRREVIWKWTGHMRGWNFSPRVQVWNEISKNNKTMRNVSKEQNYTKQNQDAHENYNHPRSGLGEMCSRHCWSPKSNFRRE